jgi:hypothetical protein
MDMLDLGLAKDRLAANAPSLRNIGYAADFNAAMQPGAVIASPSAFVLITGEEWIPPRDASAPMRQSANITVSVLVAVKLAGPLGANGLAALEQPVREARLAMFAWHHPDAEGPFALSGGGIEDFNGQTGVLLYRLDFTALAKIQETL